MTVMSKKPIVRFRPSARLQRYLGQELIADPNLALIEFVKNAYDAGASEVRIDFHLDSASPSVTIADDGVGMDFEGFERNWMSPGYSEKSPDAPKQGLTGKPNRGAAATRERARTKVGEKGLGRLAAGRLGATMDVFTRASRSSPWLHVPFVWAEFDDMTRFMDEVEIAYDYVTTVPEQTYATGTVIVIGGLRQQWEGRLRGRPSPGRSRTRLGRLRQDLELVVGPLRAQDAEFKITLASDLISDPTDVGVITPAKALESGAYRYEFDYRVDEAGRPAIRRAVARSTEVVEVTGSQPSEEFPRVALSARLAKAEDRPPTLDCGEFTGVFVYNPPPVGRRALEIDASGVGVLLYRDGLIVEPYGLDGNDWVGVGRRKAQRQGHAAIQPDTFAGFVAITRAKNPTLLDMSNRLGLLQNDASDAFIAHVQAEFLVFDDLVYKEFVSKRWEGKKAGKAGDQARSTAETTNVFVRAIAHSIRQPLTALSAEVAGIRALASRGDTPPDLAARLMASAERATKHLVNANRILAEVLEFELAELGWVDLRTILDAAVTQVQALAESMDVQLDIRGFGAIEVFVPRAVVVQALASLLTNAIEVPRPEGRAASVELRVEESTAGDPVVVIADNGAGFPSDSERASLSEIDSDKGRPAAGLALAELSLSMARGRVTLVSSGPSGSELHVALPDRLAGLRD